MRQHPIGTGPFKFVEFKPNEYIKVARNPDYWKKGRPYLDGIEYTIIRNLSTAILAFVAGKFDMTFAYSVTEPLLKDVKRQMPGAICELAPIGVNRSLIANRESRPSTLGPLADRDQAAHSFADGPPLQFSLQSTLWPAKSGQRRPAVAATLDQHVEDLAFVVDGTPEVHPLAGDSNNHLV
jgi:Bacterial extracellular solute-binding proteins, family 5 Middle